jgi:hypothetical protein
MSVYDRRIDHRRVEAKSGLYIIEKFSFCMVNSGAVKKVFMSRPVMYSVIWEAEKQKLNRIVYQYNAARSARPGCRQWYL